LANATELPNSELARVDRTKVVNYLLNLQHLDGASKAAFFELFGFLPDNWEVLASALRNLATNGTVMNHLETIHSVKYSDSATLRL